MTNKLSPKLKWSIHTLPNGDKLMFHFLKNIDKNCIGTSFSSLLLSKQLWALKVKYKDPYFGANLGFDMTWDLLRVENLP